MVIASNKADNSNRYVVEINHEMVGIEGAHPYSVVDTMRSEWTAHGMVYSVVDRFRSLDCAESYIVQNLRGAKW